MLDKRVLFQRYLANEYKDVMRVAELNRDLIEVVPDEGEVPPHVSKYLVTYRVPTWVKDGDEPRLQDSTQVRVEIIDRMTAPRTYAVGGKVPYHANWFNSGLMNNGAAWRPDWRLANYLDYILGIVEFQASCINTMCASNREAASWWEAHKDEADKFPTDTRSLKLPAQDHPKFRIRLE